MEYETKIKVKQSGNSLEFCIATEKAKRDTTKIIKKKKSTRKNLFSFIN